MALSNILKNGTYSVVDEVTISRRNKLIQFSLYVYSDSSKEELIMVRPFLIVPSSYVEVRSISSTPNVGNPVEHDKVFIPMDHVGDYESFKGKIISYNGQFWEEFSYQDAIITVDRKKMYRIRADGLLAKAIHGSVDLWDNYFTSSVSTNSNTNIVKQCYKYIKDSEFYEEAVDA